jgi:hypothetical protein
MIVQRPREPAGQVRIHAYPRKAYDVDR